MFTSCALVFLGLVATAPAVQMFKFLDSKTPVRTVRLGFSMIIDCETTDASAFVTLWKLKKGKEILVQPSLNVIQSGQIFTLHNIALDNVGHYKCRAQDSMGSKIAKNVYVIINTYRPSLVIRPSKPVIVLTGSTVSFTCEASAGTIMWRHEPNGMSNNPKPSKYTVTTTSNASITISVLTIPNAQVTNSGLYDCWLYHHDTKLFRNVDLVVKDSKRPVFTNGNSMAEVNTVKLGHAKYLNCEVDGFPKPVISWEKDGNPISLCRKMFLHTCQGSPYLSKSRGLKIASARFPEDNGTYTCVAKNSVGTSRKDFHVVVQVKPVLDKSTSLVMKSSTITCHAIQGNPPPKFIWSMQLFYFPMTKSPNEKGWRPLSKYRNTATTSSDGMTTTVKVPSMIARAFYRCVAVNNAGRDTHTIKMFLR